MNFAKILRKFNLLRRTVPAKTVAVGRSKDMISTHDDISIITISRTLRASFYQFYQRKVECSRPRLIGHDGENEPKPGQIPPGTDGIKVRSEIGWFHPGVFPGARGRRAEISVHAYTYAYIRLFKTLRMSAADGRSTDIPDIPPKSDIPDSGDRTKGANRTA